MRDMEPVRLFEAGDAPVKLQGLLRQAQQDRPSNDEAARLVRTVEARMAAGIGSSAPAARRLWPTGHGRLPGRLIVAVVLAGAGTVGYFVVQRHISTPAPAAIARSAVSTPGIPAAEPEAVDPVAVAPEPAATPPSAKAPEGVRTRGKVRGIAQRHSPPPEPALTEGASAEEFALLRAARQAVATEPERALRLTGEHAQRFPAGMLAQEREAIAIEALAKMGRAAQAQSRAQTFLKAHPGSPYRPRIDAALSRLSGSRPSP